MQSQTVRRLIIFWAYSYARPSNFGRFAHIFLAYNMPVRPLTEAMAKVLAERVKSVVQFRL